MSGRATSSLPTSHRCDSCGWAVPFMEYKGERDQLRRYIDHMELDAWHESRLTKNAKSIDGLPGLKRSEAAE